MEVRVVRWGDDLVVRLTSEEADRLGISEGQTVELIASPSVRARPKRRHVDGLPVYTMDEMVAEARRLGPGAEPPTVDWGPDRASEIIDDDAAPY